PPRRKDAKKNSVTTPTKVGVHRAAAQWIPAFAGMGSFSWRLGALAVQFFWHLGPISSHKAPTRKRDAFSSLPRRRGRVERGLPLVIVGRVSAAQSAFRIARHRRRIDIRPASSRSGAGVPTRTLRRRNAHVPHT